MQDQEQQPVLLVENLSISFDMYRQGMEKHTVNCGGRGSQRFGEKSAGSCNSRNIAKEFQGGRNDEILR